MNASIYNNMVHEGFLKSAYQACHQAQPYLCVQLPVLPTVPFPLLLSAYSGLVREMLRLLLIPTLPQLSLCPTGTLGWPVYALSPHPSILC